MILKQAWLQGRHRTPTQTVFHRLVPNEGNQSVQTIPTDGWLVSVRLGKERLPSAYLDP
ncbi:MAG: hypothetical protein OXC92_01795 [Flavobacteriaceae bacterium]|nr:hypothetical protein [Flavobacteriaceae bacterium]